MPLKVVLQTIDGKRLAEAVPPKAALNRLIPFGDVSFPLLRFVDPYGDTIFNGAQMRGFLPEWSRLIQGVTDKQGAEFLLSVRSMAERSDRGTHIRQRCI